MKKPEVNPWHRAYIKAYNGLAEMYNARSNSGNSLKDTNVITCLALSDALQVLRYHMPKPKASPRKGRK
jgi:hypothetical protein